MLQCAGNADDGLPRESEPTSRRVTAVTQYFEKFGDAATASTDLKLYVEQLNVAERKILLQALGCAFDDRTRNLNSNGSKGVLPLGQNVSLG